MTEAGFWNNLDSFVEQQNDAKESEKVDDWLKNHPEADKPPPKTAMKAKSPTRKPKDGENPSRSVTPSRDGKQKKQVSIDLKTKPEKRGKFPKKDDEEKKLFATKKFSRKSKLRRKRRRHGEPLYFGPLIECNFNLPRVAQQLERLMGTSVVRLTDRKFMLDLQKRIQEDYHDTLMKRISQRQLEDVEREIGYMLKPSENIYLSRTLFKAQSVVLNSELEREKRMGSTGSEKYPKMIQQHPVFTTNQKTNQLLMSKRGKLKTIREKNAEELIKQGRRWERERFQLEDQERRREIATKHEREKMLEDHTLYIFDPIKADMTGMELLKVKNRKFTEAEIDVKDFLLSNQRKRMLNKGQSSDDSGKKSAPKTPEAVSFEEKSPDEDAPKKVEVVKPKEPMKPELSLEELKKKQAKKDENPKITKFKTAETVKEIYSLAEELIVGDGKKKLLKQIKQLKKALNLSVIKAQ